MLLFPSLEDLDNEKVHGVNAILQEYKAKESNTSYLTEKENSGVAVVQALLNAKAGADLLDLQTLDKVGLFDAGYTNERKEILLKLAQTHQGRGDLKAALKKYGNLRVRMSCPICGLTDKNSVNNVYTEDTITFYCPEHGEYSINVNEGISKLEYNSPLRNLIRGMSYTATNQSEKYDFEILNG